MTSPQQTPTKACHNCRRKRLRCDRAYPHCRKCVTAGRECLGYGNLFRWTGAVASRGKLAGQAAPLAPPQVADESAGKAKSPSSASSSGSLRSQTSSSTTPDRDTGLQLARRWTPTSSDKLASPWVLADPLFQDMNPSYRYYLSYFTTRLCKDLVSYDLPERNPFRSLLPMTSAHPLLQHIIVAASATHLSNMLSSVGPPLLTQGTSAAAAATRPNRVEESRLALRHALVAKQKALRLMHDALKNIESMPVDVILAAALFFVNVELIESGKHGWKAHLAGAGQIMGLLELTNTPSNELLDYLLSDCFVYFILGSAFTPASSDPAANPFYFHSRDIPTVLQKAAVNSYQCCPPDILDILHSASKLSNANVDDQALSEQATKDAAVLLQRAFELDIVAWAYDVRNHPSFSDVPVQSRIHTGMAHRLAACLYILQAVPSLEETVVGPDYADALSRELYDQLESVPDDDPNFKATSWPTFIAGARETDVERRALITDRLQRLMVQCPWGFIYTAMETLHTVWALDSEGRGRTSWVQTLKDPDLNFLMV